MASRPRLRSSNRKDSPLSPPKPASVAVVIDAPQNHNKRRTRSSGREVATAQPPSQDLENVLPTVAEEESVPEQIDGIDSSTSLSLEESSSGSSFESLLDALDGDAILDNLIKLRNESDAVFSIFESGEGSRVGDICAKLLQLDPILRRKLLSREDTLLTTMEIYGGNPSFIIPGIIVRKIFDDSGPREINNGLSRPGGVLVLANLALQLATVFRRSLEERDTYLEFMFNNFPDPFHDLDSIPFSADMVKGSLKFYTEILTQFYIRQVETKYHEEGFDPDALLAAVFYDEHNKIRGSSDEATYAKAMSRMTSIKSHFDTTRQPYINIESLTQEYPWSDFVVQVVRWSLARKKELEEMIESGGGIEKLIDSLLAKDFQDEAPLADTLSQGSELAVPETQAHDPSTADTQAEQAENTNNKSTRLTQTVTTGSLLGRAMKANINRLKALRVEHSARTPRANIDHAAPSPPIPEHEISASPSPFVDETQPAAVDGGDSPARSLPPASASDEDILPTQQTNMVLETVRRQNEQSDKENKTRMAKKASVFDRQEGAERVEWAEPSDNDDISPPPRQLLKRRRRLPQLFEDDAGHDEFETDRRATKRARVSGDTGVQSLTTRLSLPAGKENATTVTSKDVRLPDTSRTVTFANRGQPSRPARIDRSQSPDARPRTLQSATQISATGRAPLESITAAKRRPPSSAPTRTHSESFRSSSPPPAEPPASQIEKVNREAKERVRMCRDLLPTPRGGQVRIPYTQQEVNRLVELVELHGTSWARILDEDARHADGPMLQGRSQVQLKDKARNLKLLYLKAGWRLLPGFEAVSIGKRHINELQNLGIEDVGHRGARYTRNNGGDDDDIEDD